MRRLVMFSAYIAAIFTLNAAYADWEWWNEDGIEWNLNKKVTFGAAAEQKFKNDMKDIYCYNFEAGLSYECNHHLIPSVFLCRISFYLIIRNLS